MEARNLRRLQINISDSVYNMLRERAERRGAKIADVIRDDISYAQWLEGVINNPEQDLLIRENGETKQIVVIR